MNINQKRKDNMMKKLFTLLFCVVAMGLAAHAAEDTLVDQCINALLSQDQISTVRAAELDANHDGVLSIADVTTLIDLQLEAQLQIERAPARMIDVNALIKDVLESTTGEPNINDVRNAVDHNIKQEQQ